ncbi:hypothetical protein [Variovorax sp. OV329]|uniref:hypothetical protein n=1 Tax=Variovorax sp. OV329 TaxID=1882825 RepID=UPI0008F10204|nr:hypothetical protein [Variovorax sp. OV329]SFL91093.1 hypothetical protein SAMN05444747_101237 [Variovorax sp. OV329]
MINNRISSLALAALALAGGGQAWAQQQSDQPDSVRVVASSPVRNPDGSTSYSVTYEYAGRTYTTRTDSPPGSYIHVQVTPMGVMSQAPYGNQDAPPPGSSNDGGSEPWRNVAPEQGVVLSGSSGGAVMPAPVYAAPPVVYAPAPVYAPGYGYGYGYPYAYPPVGVNLNLGYTYFKGGRGWR